MIRPSGMATLAGIVVLATGMLAPRPSMDQVAEGYVRLVLAVGEHDSDYVDAYYGPPAWKAEADSEKLSLQAIKAQASSLLTVLGTPPRRADALTRLRFTYLQRSLQSLAARVEELDGRKLTFDQESRALYDAVAPSYDEAHFKRVLNRLDRGCRVRGPWLSATHRLRKTLSSRSTDWIPCFGGPSTSVGRGRGSTSRCRTTRSSAWSSWPANRGAPTTGTKGTTRV